MLCIKNKQSAISDRGPKRAVLSEKDQWNQLYQHKIFHYSTLNKLPTKLAFGPQATYLSRSCQVQKDMGGNWMNSASGLQYGLLFQWLQKPAMNWWNMAAWVQGVVEEDVYARRQNGNALKCVAATVRSSNHAYLCLQWMIKWLHDWILKNHFNSHYNMHELAKFSYHCTITFKAFDIPRYFIILC